MDDLESLRMERDQLWQTLYEVSCGTPCSEDGALRRITEIDRQLDRMEQ